MQELVSCDEATRLYTLKAGSGHTCLGFDVAFQRAMDVSASLTNIGTPDGYRDYTRILHEGREYANRTDIRCDANLTPVLIGLEGKRIEVVDCWGEKRRFIVGKSTGWLPVHLEIARRTSSGGPAVSGAPFRSLRVVG